jgi:hypothetical protein
LAIIVVHRDLGEPEACQHAERVAPDEQVGPRGFAEARRRFVPEVAHVERRALEVQHPVVLGDQVQPPAWPGHARELGVHAVGVRDGVGDVAAHGEVERSVGQPQSEDAAVLERQPRRQRGLAHAGQLEVRVQHVHAQHAGARVVRREARGDLAGAAARVQHADVVGERVAPQQLDLLRPDRLGLRREVARHGFVGHMVHVRVQVGHGLLHGMGASCGVREGEA